MGMVLGPFTQAEATTACQCRTDELCVGGMAGIQEADKVRTIFDAAVIGEANADKKIIAPALFDLLIARASLGGSVFILFKSDVNKAHRRVKVTRRHWRYIIAAVTEKFWLNMVGHLWCGLCPVLLGKDGSASERPCLPPHACNYVDLRLRGRLHGTLEGS